MTTSRVEAAVAAGMSPEQAQQAGSAYNETVVELVSQGVPLAEAITRAEAVFQAEASFPVSTPQQAMGSSLASGNTNVAEQITALSGAKTEAGSTAFDQALSQALAKGQSFAQAVKTAQAAVAKVEALAAANATPQSQLASGGGEMVSALSAKSEAFQQALSDMLAQGVPLEQAIQRAEAAAAAMAGAAAADARSPSVALATGNPAALPRGTVKGGSFDKALQAALARGLTLEEALAQAAAIDAFERRAAEAEAKSVTYGLSTGGTSLLPKEVDEVFDRALANAIGRGLPPNEAIEVARAAAARNAAVKPSASTALASGNGGEVLVYLVGSSRTYRMVLSNALARGMAVDKAIELAKRAELANAFRFRLPANVARVLPANGKGVTVVQVNGAPMPSWLALSYRTREFVAVEVPDGGLPVAVVISIGKQDYRVSVSEGPLPTQQAAFDGKTPKSPARNRK